MKKLLIVGCLGLLVAVVMVAGCTNPASPGATPASPRTQGQDPIIGVWRQTNSMGADNRMRFNADGTYESSMAFPKTDVMTFYGTWKAQGGNSYVLNQTATNLGPEKVVVQPQIMIYSPGENTLCFSETANWPYTSYNGDVMPATSTAKK